nr:purine-nucleoside/S-methyl-5-thioadenosine phosphorylase / adenosine deaminase [Candidatus Cloacimonadota bacterium]
MSRIFFYLGDKSLDYQTLVDRHDDILIDNKRIPISRIIIAEQTHSDLVHRCRSDDCGAGIGDHPSIPACDALISNIPNQYLLIRTADCYPILLFDPIKEVVGAVHSGRAGTQKNITGKTIQMMIEEFGCDPGNIVAYVGAGICEEHYEVGSDLFEAFNEELSKNGFNPFTNLPGHLNLRRTIFQQLIRAGLRFINIENIHICTFEDPAYFSYRRDHGNNRQVNIIGISYE